MFIGELPEDGFYISLTVYEIFKKQCALGLTAVQRGAARLNAILTGYSSVALFSSCMV